MNTELYQKLLDTEVLTYLELDRYQNLIELGKHQDLDKMSIDWMNLTTSKIEEFLKLQKTSAVVATTPLDDSAEEIQTSQGATNISYSLQVKAEQIEVQNLVQPTDSFFTGEQGAIYKPASKYLTTNSRTYHWRHYCYCCSNTIPLSYQLTREPLYYYSDFSCGHTRYRAQPRLSGHYLNNTVSRWIKSRLDAIRKSKPVLVQFTDSFFDPLPLSAYSNL
jgi:hypothetical protein